MTAHLKLHLLAVLLCPVLILCACSHQGAEIDTNDFKKVMDNDNNIVIAALNEDFHPIGEIASFNMINEDKFVVSMINPSSVIIYDLQGNQVKKISRTGRGPFEYTEPSIVRTYDNKIYVWCRQQLKLIIYDEYGTPIREHNEFERAITDFIPSRNQISYMISGGYKGSVIETYDLNKKSIVSKHGTPTEEHILLNLAACSGGLSAYDENLIYATTDQLNINVVNINTQNHVETIRFYDQDFIIERINGSASDMINGNRNDALEYLLNNSLITGLFTTDKFIVLMAEVGTFTFDSQIRDNSQRFNSFYILDKDFALQQVSVYSHDFRNNNCLFDADARNIYYLQLSGDAHDYLYTLNKMEITIREQHRN